MYANGLEHSRLLRETISISLSLLTLTYLIERPRFDIGPIFCDSLYVESFVVKINNLLFITYTL